MRAHPSLATLLESFFRNRLAKQRNASPSTIASYRDALRMLVLFAAERTRRKPNTETLVIPEIQSRRVAEIGFGVCTVAYEAPRMTYQLRCSPSTFPSLP